MTLRRLSNESHNNVWGMLELIKQIPPESIDLLVTSPPYWARVYNNGEDEIGSEETLKLMYLV